MSRAWRDMRNCIAYRMFVENSEGKRTFGRLGVDGKMILKQTL
jgi:hypothetical protein